MRLVVKERAASVIFGKITENTEVFRIFFGAVQKNEKIYENLLTNARFWYIILTTEKSASDRKKG